MGWEGIAKICALEIQDASPFADKSEAKSLRSSIKGLARSGGIGCKTQKPENSDPLPKTFGVLAEFNET